MNVILIDPAVQAVTALELGDSWRDIAPALSTPEHRVSTFTCVGGGPKGATVYVDDEGLLVPGVPVFGYGGQVLAGRGLVFGTSDEGDSLDCPLTVDEVRALVTFSASETTGEMTPSREVTPPEGFDFTLEGGRGILAPVGTFPHA
jgi:hypothetical protein